MSLYQLCYYVMCMYLSSPIIIIIKLIILNLARANVRAIMSRYCPQDYF